MRGGSAFRVALLWLHLLGCGGERPKPPSPESSPADAPARVAGVVIPASVVAAVGGTRGEPARSALDALVEDALVARAALDQHLDHDPAVALAADLALARRIPRSAMADARAAGPPSDEELESVTVVQAVVMRSANLSEDNALAVANNVARAVAGSRSADEFQRRVKDLPWQHARVIAQMVGPFTIDGRTPDGVIDPTFVAASFALPAPLRISGVVATPFGWHVIQMVSREPSKDLSAERRAALSDAAIEIRARTGLAEVLRRHREGTPVEISHDAEPLMARAVGAAP